MNKAGQSDQLYSSLITLLNAKEYENAYILFNSGYKYAMLYPDQIPQLRAAIEFSNLFSVNRLFYDQINAMLSIYSDALKGTLVLNDYYINFVCKKS